MKRILFIISLFALTISILMPSAVRAAESACPTPAAGQCVYHRAIDSGPEATGKYIGPFLGNLLSTYDDYLYGAAVEVAAANNTQEIDESCELIAICYSILYEKNKSNSDELLWKADNITWKFTSPININMDESVVSKDIPLILDFRGPEDEKLIFMAADGALESWPDDICALNINNNNVFVGGIQVIDAPFDGVCIPKGVANSILDAIDIFNSGDDGLVIEGDNNTVTGLNSSYNEGDGVETSGSNNNIDDAIIINNGGYGVNNVPGATNNGIDNAYVAGNGAGNFLDEDGTLQIGPNVKEECPPGYQMTQIGLCRRECPTGQYDYFGECVFYCPIGLEPHASGFCLKSNMAPKMNLPYTPDPRSSDGCSLIPIPFSLGGLTPYLLTLIPIGPFVIFRRKKRE